MSPRRSDHLALPIPNGWFAVAWSRDLVPGEVKPIHYFGEDLVLFRTRSGRAVVLDAYCPHLGAHLGEGGRVIGEGIRCPFHGWHFDADGRCDEIPYCKRVPPAAATRSWPVDERNEMIFVWHHAEGKPPDWQVPDMPELSDPAWTEPRFFEIEVNVHMQDMAENNCDPVHFHFVHGQPEIPPQEVSYSDGGRTMHAVSRATRETPFGTFDTELWRDTWGLGLAAVRLTGIPGAGLLMYSSTTPVHERRTHSRWLFTVSRNLADLAGEEFIDGLMQGVKQDFRIWENKIHPRRPVFCEGDHFLGEFRRWARQFYSEPIASIPEEA